MTINVEHLFGLDARQTWSEILGIQSRKLDCNFLSSLINIQRKENKIIHMPWKLWWWLVKLWNDYQGHFSLFDKRFFFIKLSISMAKNNTVESKLLVDWMKGGFF